MPPCSGAAGPRIAVLGRRLQRAAGTAGAAVADREVNVTGETLFATKPLIQGEFGIRRGGAGFPASTKTRGLFLTDVAIVPRLCAVTRAGVDRFGHFVPSGSQRCRGS